MLKKESHSTIHCSPYNDGHYSCISKSYNIKVYMNSNIPLIALKARFMTMRRIISCLQCIVLNTFWHIKYLQ